MPIFKGLFGSDVELPLYTRFLLNSTDFINIIFLLVIFFIILILIGIKSLLKLKKINTLKDYLVFKIPAYGVVKNYVVIARFTRTLNIFIKSAVPIFVAFDSIGAIVENEYIATRINSVRNQIMTGSKIADAIEKEKLFEPLLVQMIRIGEETGRMEEMLKRLSEIYDKKLEVGITKLMGMVEPMFTLIIGGFVGSVIIAMAIPILTISQNM
jgi:type IV pilus assembly protein PilC